MCSYIDSMFALYLVTGIVLFAVFDGCVHQMKAVKVRRPVLYIGYILAVFLLWPMRPLIQYYTSERIIKQFD